MAVLVVCCIFSIWLMWHTFSYDPQGYFLLSPHVWSDFGAAIPLLRSFSFGSNWPPQHPLFPGLPIRYHFLFYLMAGSLERFGLRIDFALNLLSAFGFALLLYLIYKVSSRLFQNFWVGIVSVLFFLFNGSFSFVDFLRQYSLPDLLHLKNFVSFAPWNSSLVTAFWNLNIYTNQRHLGLSFGVALLIIYLMAFPGRLIYLIGFLLGFLYFTNQAAFAISVLFIVWFMIIGNRNLKKRLLLSLIGFLPWVPFIKYLALPVSQVHTQFGWLMRPPVTLANWTHFWWYNLGLHLFLIPLGILLAPKKAKLLSVPLFILFIVPNIFQLSTDLINNHKFFNFFLIIGVMFSANLLIKIAKIRPLYLIVPFIIVLSTAGGIVDIFPIINSTYIRLNDLANQPVAAYFNQHTRPESIVLNSTWFYHPASLAGRKIFNGYSYFVWSYGYDQAAREQLATRIYSSLDKSSACTLLIANSIDYVELSDHHESFIHPNWLLWRNQFHPIFTSVDTSIYSVRENCV